VPRVRSASRDHPADTHRVNGDASDGLSSVGRNGVEGLDRGGAMLVVYRDIVGVREEAGRVIERPLGVTAVVGNSERRDSLWTLPDGRI
jgi:hypothetical protein